ncbi:MAG: alpha-glucan family phosphorylase [Caldimicrobium sp.]
MEFRKCFVYPKIPGSLEKLVSLAYNLWFTMDFDALNLFYKVDANLFRKVNHNPVKFIHLLSSEKIKALSQDQRFLNELTEILEDFEEYKKRRHPLLVEKGVSEEDYIAYFSTEFALHESLPMYAGGLGVLAGDIMYGASDLDIPLIGISLHYSKGYFKQKLEANTQQKEEPEKIDKFLNLLREVKDEKGHPLIIELSLLGEPVKIKIWKLEVGRRFCLFLDTDISENREEVRTILDYLYPAEPEKRLKQEIILGMGGYLALKRMGIEPKLYHLNEGHSAFVILSRLKDLIFEKGLSYHEARLFIQETTIFTTHTPVIAGNEHFDMKLVQKYLEPEVKALGLTMEDLAQCGCIYGDSSVFWLPAMAIRYSKYVNAVSKLHQITTKKMWAPLFEDWLLEEIPIDYVTNGVHWRWLSEPFYKLLRDYVSPDFKFLDPDDPSWEEIFNIPDEEIWEAHKKNKQQLVNLINKHLEEELLKKPTKEAEKWMFPLKRFQLIVGCARRITGYKRNNLILFDKDRLLRLLKDTEKPILFVFAGKAHPKDIEGKKMLQELLEFRNQYQVEDRFIFIENYNLHLARYIIWGSDVWLNTPYRPFEASGTSGMKAALNGVLNLSVLDGWWVEGYDGQNGWAIQGREGLPPHNYYEANQIYTLLEGEIRNLFYQRDEEGIPRGWIKRMKRALYTACKNFTMNRVLLEYLKKFYLPAYERYRLLGENNFELLKKTEEERKILSENWDKLKILSFSPDLSGEIIWEDTEIELNLEVDLGGIPQELLQAEVVSIREFETEESVERDFEFIPLEISKVEGSRAFYTTKYRFYGHGLRKLGARILPKNDILRRAYPELIKWYA